MNIIKIGGKWAFGLARGFGLARFGLARVYCSIVDTESATWNLYTCTSITVTLGTMLVAVIQRWPVYRGRWCTGIVLVDGFWDLYYTGWYIEGDLPNQVAVSTGSTLPNEHMQRDYYYVQWGQSITDITPKQKFLDETQ